MEGHPRHEDPGATPAPERVDSSDATRKRVFLRLDNERRSLAAQRRRPWRLRDRYEDLTLVLMLARLERDCLSQSRPDLSAGGQAQGKGDVNGQRLADWASPWGAAPRMKLDADIGRVDGALKRLGRWLSARTAAKAQSRARLRLEAIAAELEERDPHGLAAAAGQGGATKAPGFELPTRARVAAIAGLLLLAAGAGAFLLATQTASGPGGSVDRQGAVARTGQDPAALDSRIQRGSEGRDQGKQPASPPDRPKAQGRPTARSQGAGQSAPAASEVAPPAAEPVSVTQPAAAPAPPAAAAPSSTSSQATSAKGGGGCPPEFGYEC